MGRRFHLKPLSKFGESTSSSKITSFAFSRLPGARRDIWSDSCDHHGPAEDDQKDSDHRGQPVHVDGQHVVAFVHLYPSPLSRLLKTKINITAIQHIKTSARHFKGWKMTSQKFRINEHKSHGHSKRSFNKQKPW